MRISKPPEERKKEIVKAAMELFMTKGYKNTTISDITKKLKISHGLLYYHFKSKEQVLAEGIILNNKRLIEELNFPDLFGGDLSANKKINILMETVFRYISNDLDLIKNSKKFNGSIFIDKVQFKTLDIIIKKLTEFIIQGNEEGNYNCKYPKECAEIIIYGLQRKFYNALEEDPNIENLTLVEYYMHNRQMFLDIFVNMIGARDTKDLFEFNEENIMKNDL
ncbi:MAG: TetR/AcrR family transcriptional regulator [Epulopiscium sp.]|jgi:hypothetical protein|nr:TetR/AcrR family transcriptional regulator [Candidatus Epulonipiscium sp.]